MTVPFILALGIGVANIRSDKKAEADSFGLVALCSIGPVLAVLILGFFYKGQGVADVNLPFIPETTTEMGLEYLKAFPAYMKEMAIALSPIIVLFLIFQVAAFKMSKKSFLKTLIGILYTYVGLVLFLTGVNVGFSPLGLYLGQQLYSGWTQYILIPVAMLMGWFIISAEPAVFVLEKQIEDVSSGAIPGKAIKLSLSIAIALAMGLSMIRVLTGISILWFIVPGYLVALILMFFVPDIFTAIAFDSGGVASGPMTATFMLQFFIGVCSARGGNILSDAFGAVALVAMMPLISIQITGLVYKKKKQRAERVAEVVYGDDDIIELWGTDMYFVISVINPNGLSILNNICQRLEIPVILSLIGHGTASQKIRDLWGIESTDKRILFAVADENKTKSLITEERRRLYIDAPGNGIVISVPIKSVGGGSTLNF